MVYSRYYLQRISRSVDKRCFQWFWFWSDTATANCDSKNFLELNFTTTDNYDIEMPKSYASGNDDVTRVVRAELGSN